MNNISKNIFIFVLSLFVLPFSSLFSQEISDEVNAEKEDDLSIKNEDHEKQIIEGFFCIKEIKYNSLGSTRPFVVERNITINKDKIFENQNAFELFLKELSQELSDTRLLENVSYEYFLDSTEEDKDGNKINYCLITYTFSDSIHFLALPKPSYDSNKGFELKMKMKDTNFLGFMNPLDFDLNFKLGDEDAPTDFSRITFGTNLSYDLPFKFWITEDTWTNDFSISYSNSDGLEFSFETGLDVALPFGLNKLKLSFVQGLIKDSEYKEYGDDLYNVESVTMSLPLTVTMLDDVTPLTWTPSINFVNNWDLDKIDIYNEDLRGPSVSVKQKFSYSKVSWKNNFRNGHAASTSQSLEWNFQTRNIVPYFDAEIEAYKAWKYASLSADFNVFFYTEPIAPLGNKSYKNTKNIGSYIRGALDNQTNTVNGEKALKVSSAFYLSLDAPFHIITTHWMEWGYNLFGSYDDMNKFCKIAFFIPHKLFKYLDFELQLSPFMDIALIQNTVTGNNYSWKEGLYTGGLEVLVFPAKWKSFTVRLSLGFDLGAIIGEKAGLDNSWRNPGSCREIFFGLGLHY